MLSVCWEVLCHVGLIGNLTVFLAVKKILKSAEDLTKLAPGIDVLVVRLRCVIVKAQTNIGR